MTISSAIPETVEALVAEYQRLWPLVPELHARIAKLADEKALKACAKRLGMFRRQEGRACLVFEDEMESAVFQDYLLHMYRPYGISLVQQMRNRKLFPVDSDQQRLLVQMAQARFTLVWIREHVPGAGVVALDVIGGNEGLVLDPSLSEQEVHGLVVGLRLFSWEEAWMHTGATMVMGTIEDTAGLQPLHQVLGEDDERILNEDNIRRWRTLIRS